MPWIVDFCNLGSVCCSLFLLLLDQVATAAEEYGYHMGLAFQIIDDILDIVGAADVSYQLWHYFQVLLFSIDPAGKNEMVVYIVGTGRFGRT